jgi:hypothetical protein
MLKLLSRFGCLALLLLAATVLSAQTGPAPVPALQTFTSQEGRFRILFPGEPKQETQSIQLKGGESCSLIQFSVELENGYNAYMVMYNDYPAGYAGGDPQAVLLRTRDGALSGKTLLTDAPTDLNGIPGRAFTASDPTWNYTVRQFLKDKRLYQLIIVSSADHPAALIDRFIDSFQVW